jgi:hypothetical protein
MTLLLEPICYLSLTTLSPGKKMYGLKLWRRFLYVQTLELMQENNIQAYLLNFLKNLSGVCKKASITLNVGEFLSF